MKHMVQFSGGKDSTAMLKKMIEQRLYKKIGIDALEHRFEEELL